MVSQDSLIIELDAKTRAKTVNARANWAPDFRFTVTAEAGIATGEASSPIKSDDTSPLMKLHLVGGFKRASR